MKVKTNVKAGGNNQSQVALVNILNVQTDTGDAL